MTLKFSDWLAGTQTARRKDRYFYGHCHHTFILKEHTTEFAPRDYFAFSNEAF